MRSTLHYCQLKNAYEWKCIWTKMDWGEYFTIELYIPSLRRIALFVGLGIGKSMIISSSMRSRDWISTSLIVVIVRCKRIFMTHQSAKRATLSPLVYLHPLVMAVCLISKSADFSRNLIILQSILFDILNLFNLFIFLHTNWNT